MSLLQRAKADIARYINSDSGDDITLSTPDRTVSITLKALISKHRVSINPSTGLPINSDNIHCAFSESELNLQSYPVRNAKNEVSMLRHIVGFKDCNDLESEYLIQEHWPDHTLGLIVCILARYNNGN